MVQRYLKMHDIETRADENTNELYVEGYFSVFNEIYDVWDGATESIRPGAFTDSMNGDVRALYNHNTDVVLGRTTNGTLELRQDDKGLWGRIKLNKKDTEAVNVYERIARGDITGCSFGFDIEKEERTINEDGSVHFEIVKVNPLWEVSPCVFPAYEATRIEARGKDMENIKKREHDVWVEKMRKRLKGELENGIESSNDKKEPGPEEE